MSNKTVKKAINLSGGQTSVSKALGIKQSSVWAWIKNGVPPRRVLDLERLTNGAVTRYELRPDLYPRD